MVSLQLFVVSSPPPSAPMALPLADCLPCSCKQQQISKPDPKKLQPLLDELLSTERTYVRRLRALKTVRSLVPWPASLFFLLLEADLNRLFILADLRRPSQTLLSRSFHGHHPSLQRYSPLRKHRRYRPRERVFPGRSRTIYRWNREQSRRCSRGSWRCDHSTRE